MKKAGIGGVSPSKSEEHLNNEIDVIVHEPFDDEEAKTRACHDEFWDEEATFSNDPPSNEVDAETKADFYQFWHEDLDEHVESMKCCSIGNIAARTGRDDPLVAEPADEIVIVLASRGRRA